MTSGNRCFIEIRRHQTKDTGQRARQIMDAVSDNYATTRRDRYIRLTQKSNTKCFSSLIIYDMLTKRLKVPCLVPIMLMECQL